VEGSGCGFAAAFAWQGGGKNHIICESGWCSNQGTKEAPPAYKCELFCHK